MKLWVSPRHLPNNPNPNRSLSSNTLYIRHNHSILLSRTYLPRRKLWMTNPLSTCQRGLYIFHLPFHSRRPGNLLWLLHSLRNLKHWHYPISNNHGYSIRRIRPSMRTNILLRCHRNYKPPLSNPLHWKYSSRMNLRWLLSRQSYPYSLLRLPLYPSLYHHSPRLSPPPIPP